MKSSILRQYVGVSLISASVLALQIIFTRIFSITIWYHFTYLVIGVALLGGGAAGTFLALRQWTPDQLKSRTGNLSLMFSVVILVSLLVIVYVEMDPLRRSGLPQTLLGLSVYFATLFSIFFLGGLTIAAAFSAQAQNAHRLYFADLMGAGISTLGVIWLVHIIGAPGALVFVALIALAAAVSFGISVKNLRALATVLGVGQIFLLTWIVAANPIQLPVPESKELGWALRAFDFDKPEYSAWNPVAKVDVLPKITVKEPMIVGGVSSYYMESIQKPGETFDLHLVTLDGTSMTGIYEFDGNIEHYQFLEHAVISAPYHAGLEHPKTLLIGVGGGMDIIMAKVFGATSVTAIELNSNVVHLLEEPYAEFGGHLADESTTTLIVAEGRSFILRDQNQYDLIQGIGLDNLAALSGGAYVLAESYIYTVDSLGEVYERLSPNGIFSWTYDTNNPPREMLRLTGLAAETLRRKGVTSPADHIAIVANEANTVATLLMSKSQFTPEVILDLVGWAEINRFPVLHVPFEHRDTVYADFLYAENPEEFANDYPFQIQPVTDNNPFFYNYFRWDKLFSQDSVLIEGRSRFPIGNIILITLFSLSVFAAVLFILLPLFRHKKGGLQAPSALPMLTYFSALGIGYIFVQVILIQRFTLFIGYPTVATTTTIFSMLIFNAMGSWTAQYLIHTAARLRIATLLVAGIILTYMVGLPTILRSMMELPDQSRILISVGLIAPLAFAMGMPFPTGLRQLSIQANGLVPWAWGMNGVFSVVGSVLVIIVSMLSDFTVATVTASVFYGLAGGVATSLWKVRLENVSESDLNAAPKFVNTPQLLQD